jgi:hypothetical protein
VSGPHPYCTDHDQPLDWCGHPEPSSEISVKRDDAALLAVIANDDERPAVKAAVMRVLAAVATSTANCEERPS